MIHLQPSQAPCTSHKDFADRICLSLSRPVDLGFPHHPPETRCEPSIDAQSFTSSHSSAFAPRSSASADLGAVARGSDEELCVAFVYGTLKRGFGNHWLMEELLADGHAVFVGEARTKKRFPLVCGPFQVPFLLNFPTSGHFVRGEVYQVDKVAMARLDELEGVTKGHYERHPVVVTTLETVPAMDMVAQAYFAAPSYSFAMAGAPHIPCYSQKEASTYIRRKDRPQNRTFLEHVFAWIEELGLTKCS